MYRSEEDLNVIKNKGMNLLKDGKVKEFKKLGLDELQIIAGCFEDNYSALPPIFHTVDK